MSLSPDQRDFAARLLRKAADDLAIIEALLDNERISDDGIGFHAQQAVGVEVPDEVAATRWLTPWAADFRYDEHDIAGFSRAESLAGAKRAMEWAQGVLDGAA